MGVLHALYGFGLFVSPLVSTQFAQVERWSFFYFSGLGLALANTATLAIVFRGRSQAGMLLIFLICISSHTLFVLLRLLT
jgi:hypothetical protein